jgi:ketosteroid isomerase-like protein
MTTGPTPALMADINAAFNSRDVESIMTFFTDDATFLMARGPEADGRRVHGKAASRRSSPTASRSSATCAGTTSTRSSWATAR